MFEEIFTNQGFDHITENILINLNVKSIWRCRLVCKDLHKFIKSLEKSEKLKKHDFKPCKYGRTASKLEGLAGDFGTPGFLMKMVTSKVPINPHPV